MTASFGVLSRLGRVYRRAYALLLGISASMGVLAIIAAIWLRRPLVDPEGFLGPSWLRLPLLLSAAFLIDIVPRVIWEGRGRFSEWKTIARNRIKTHWTRERLVLVGMGIICFYVTYVSYRNLKSFLPFVMGEKKYDRELHMVDRMLFFGHEPANVLHTMFGWDPMAHVFSTIYLWFLPLVPLAVTGWVVWSRNITFGYWFVTSQSIAWTLGTASYYALPTLGPGFQYPWLYAELPETGSSLLMEALSYGRAKVIFFIDTRTVQSVAGFASLHTAITLLVALMVHYTLRSKVLKWIFWINFGVTVIATLFFGWHYVADDIAGVVIALVSFYVGGVASGQKFDRHGLGSHPTSTTSAVPVDDD